MAKRKPKQAGYRWGPGPNDTTPGFRDAQSPKGRNTTGQGMDERRGNRRIGGTGATPGRSVVGVRPVGNPGRFFGKPNTVPTGGKVGTNPVPRPGGMNQLLGPPTRVPPKSRPITPNPNAGAGKPITVRPTTRPSGRRVGGFGAKPGRRTVPKVTVPVKKRQDRRRKTGYAR